MRAIMFFNLSQVEIFTHASLLLMLGLSLFLIASGIDGIIEGLK